MKAAMSEHIKEILKDDEGSEKLMMIGIGYYGHIPTEVIANGQKYEVTLLRPSI
jgi:hypothetical protein